MHPLTSTHMLLLLCRVLTNISLPLFLIITDPTTTTLFTTIILSHRVLVEVKQFLLCLYQGQCRVLVLLVLVTMSPADHILQMS